MAETKDGAALKYEGASSESLSGIVDKVELHLCRHVTHSVATVSTTSRTVPTVLAVVRTRQAGTNRSCSSEPGCKTVVGIVVGSGPPTRWQHPNLLDYLRNRSDILLNEDLRSRKALVVELRCRDVTEVSNEAAAQKVNERINVAIVARNFDTLQPLVDQFVIVMPANRVVAPQVEAEESVKPDGGFLPLVKLGSIAKDVEPDFNGAAASIPFTEFLGG